MDYKSLNDKEKGRVQERIKEMKTKWESEKGYLWITEMLVDISVHKQCII